MTITLPHKLGQQEAIARIDKGLEELKEMPFPGGIKMKDLTKTWSDNVLSLSFKIGKFLLNTSVSGRITVNEQDLVIDVDVPPMISAFLPTAKLQEGMKALGNRLVG